MNRVSEPYLINVVREMVLDGTLAPGERVTEVALSNRLGVSRTPVRNVLPALAAEGLLRPLGKRGFAVAEFDDRQSLEALSLRGTLEGHAAKTIAEQGSDPKLLALLDHCLAEGDAIFRGTANKLVDRERYGAMNRRFHSLVVAGAQSPLVVALLDRLNRVPFVSPALIVFDRVNDEDVFDMLFRAHGHHHAIVEAIRHREGARAEALFREHAYAQRASMFDRRVLTASL